MVKHRFPRICVVCKEPFCAQSQNQNYCSSACRSKELPYYKNRKELKKRCPICGNEYITLKGKQMYCSNECQVKANKIRILTKEYNNPPALLKLRFQVLERDKFRCQYCGRGIADGVKLAIDHIIPVSKNGKTELNNLITACYDCKTGKSDVLLNQRTTPVA